MSAKQSDFAFALYRSTCEGQQGNVVICPLGFSVAFSLLLNGADGKTAQEIRQAIGFEDLSFDSVNDQSMELQRALMSLNDEPGQSFTLANSLWASLPMRFAPSFIETAQRFYAIEIHSVPALELPPRVSEWSRMKTRDKVDMVIEPTDFALLSAAYFKGQWKRPFVAQKTKLEEFHPDGEKPSPVPMMSQQGQYPYFAGQNFQMVSLPFTRARMTFLLPNHGHSLHEVEQQVMREAWILTQPMADLPGFIKIPRFKVRFDGDFVRVLRKLGMERLFESFDSLRAAVTHPFGAKVTQVLQNSMITVDEKGAEAASVLAISVRAGAAAAWKQPKPFEFIADRPFCFWITDDLTGSILFLGRVAEI